MEKVITNVYVCKADIKEIGFSKINNDGYLSIITTPEASGAEQILLRSILQCWGDYHITEVGEYSEEDDPSDVNIEFKTDLPSDKFLEWIKTQD